MVDYLEGYIERSLTRSNRRSGENLVAYWARRERESGRDDKFYEKFDKYLDWVLNSNLELNSFEHNFDKLFTIIGHFNIGYLGGKRIVK